MIWLRRRTVLGGLLTILPAARCSCAAAGRIYDGCWLPGADASRFLEETEKGKAALNDVLVAESGVDGLELALVQTLDLLSTMFGILPGFSYYREHGAPNAKATNVNLMKDRTDGTVLLGVKLLKQLLQLPDHPDAAVVAVCAHEFAHILSYSNGMIDRLAPRGSSSPFRSEQFADYMAGYFAGRRKLNDAGFPAVVFATATGMYGGGDHGTSDQRSLAVQEGFKAAYYRQLEPSQASRRALSFALEGD
jgi:hypothetical protein